MTTVSHGQLFRLLDAAEAFLDDITLCCELDTGFTECAGVEYLMKALAGSHGADYGSNLKCLRCSGNELRRIVMEIRATRLGISMIQQVRHESPN